MAHNLFSPPDYRVIQNQPTSSEVASEENADVDEPPDHTPRPHTVVPNFGKNATVSNTRKQSVLTKMLHSSEEAESVDEDDYITSPTEQRGMSTTSTWSNPSVASCGELTSDGGLTSPDTRASTPSPPPPTTVLRTTLPSVTFNPKPFALRSPVITDAPESIDPLQKLPSPEEREKVVEAGLGRKRCVTFGACGAKKEQPKPTAAPANNEAVVKIEAPVPRKCALRFICPSKAPNNEETNAARKPSLDRRPSPAPVNLKTVMKTPPRARRASISSNGSPITRPVRKSASASRLRRLSDAADRDVVVTERTCEYAGPRTEDDDWMKERTCHRSRLTVDDTLKVEMKLRALGKEAEEEEEIEAEEELDEGLDEVDVDEDDEEEDAEAEDEEEDEEDNDVGELTATGEDVSDDGFYSDDEGGMASSDEESDAESDYNWWAPGRSTAATSYDQLDHLHFTRQRNMSGSSIGSISSTKAISGDKPDASPKRRKRRAIPIQKEADLPDSTDFVCGTLDEDRPMEEAYIRSIQERRAAKHRVTPQDIDPTFPTSDPEMDEEDDEDVFENHHDDESDRVDGVFGNFEDDADVQIYTGRPRGRATRSPQPSPRRVHSPAPKRMHSPPPRRGTVHRSPPPRKLFGQSPRRMRSPPPAARLRSPPPTRRHSFARSPKGNAIEFQPIALAERPRGQNMYSSSLPRKPNLLHRHRAPSPIPDADYESGEDRLVIPARGAVDIVKGLEKKRQLRREKLYQKYCRQRANGNGPKKEEKRFLPGKGAERMREMGLELAGRWKGEKRYQYGGMGTGPNAQHILSL